MLVKELLPKLKLGSSVAEHDRALARYFIETDTFRALVHGERDIIAGDKGTGKTALYQILQQRYASMPELRDTEVIPAFNPVGNPVFQRLTENEPLEEGQYVGLWKSYFLSLAGNSILEIYEDDLLSPNMEELAALLEKTGLRSKDASANTIFSLVANLFRRLANPDAAEFSLAGTPQGLPIITARVELGGDAEAPPEAGLIEHDTALRLLDAVLTETGYKVWLVLDRLDEAFVGFPEAEIPALRALFRSYLDFQEFENIKLKLFVRRDLFGRIIEGGFVNLTHVNARKVEILWDDEDLFDLLCRRIEENHELISDLGLENRPREEAFDAVFPAQVDAGGRRPTTWNWMLSRISDGNGIRPPRNLIDLATKAQEAQQRREARENREYAQHDPLISGDSLKRGLEALSGERVEDTLLAEAGDYADAITRFRDGKAEHNLATVARILKVPEEEALAAAKPLMNIGFLEQTGETLKVPMLYRDGLNITQGKAFEVSDDGAADIEVKPT